MLSKKAVLKTLKIYLSTLFSFFFEQILPAPVALTIKSTAGLFIKMGLFDCNV